MKRFFEFLTMPCEGYAELMSASMDTDLSRLDRVAVRFHTLYCSGCRRYRKHLGQLRRMSSELGQDLADAESMKLSSGARDRLRETLRQKM